MYKRAIYTIAENEPLTASVWRMVLRGDTRWITRPGQFVNIELEGRYLRRPISVCDYDADTVTLIYKVVGGGTEQMSRMRAGRTLDLLTGLGNGFDATAASRRPLLVGGGVGVPPLYNLARVLLAAGKPVTVVLGFNSAGEVFYADEFRALGARVVVATVDGSAGVKGFVTDAIRTEAADCDYFFACGPMPMLKALSQAVPYSGQLSFEERMGCGFGACMGCSCKTLTGNKRICKEGPVMRKEEIVWER
ncbi:dihydroorotate dehydrogenase electron transfer subunit [uncultured Alistipes sp.]|uniref:dihydroorotate dehydrogenase electron transfer subunit n=1 Tax=uncultured Alistipes sp. TaxID=538949 RepID=UPI0026295B7D|nr:dihydroorotate dehydrogenase electron transfer subunit [uncultured Alistipes sp.]